MDELTIDDKVYISSKRAAQITGYAKDYVGQLCREGYVEARRVGRNWYVLEAAIRDHRFGSTPQKEAVPALTPAVVAPSHRLLEKAWEAPKYEAITSDPLPSINRLRADEEAALPAPKEAKPGQDFHEAWQTWFDTFRTGEKRPESRENGDESIKKQEGLVLVPVEEARPGAIATDATESYHNEAIVPIRALPQEAPRYALLPKKAPPMRVIETQVEDTMSKHYKRLEADLRPRSLVRLAVYIVSILIILTSTGIAAVGTGKFDKIFISDNRASIITGIVVYKKI